MEYDFNEIINRRSTESLKWRAYKDESVLPLWVADMDFRSPEPVVQALLERVRHAVFGYPLELPELREEIVSWIAERYSWRIEPHELLFIPGVVTGFNLASHTVASSDGSVLIQTPVYPPMLKAAESAGMKTQGMELTQNEDGTYGIDWDIFTASLTENTRLFLLCNPHNPVGRVFTRYELEKIAEGCLRQQVIICSDEIHCDLVYPGNHHIPIASLDDEIAKICVTLIAPSKTFNIAGLEFSVAIIRDEELRKKYQKASQGLVGWPNLLGGVAALAAYRDGLDWLEQVIRYLQTNRDYLWNYIHQDIPQIRMAKPEGSYLAWLDCRHSGIDGDPHLFFLEKAKVALNDGKTFGKGGEGFVRLNFGCPRSILVEALHRIKKSFEECK